MIERNTIARLLVDMRVSPANRGYGYIIDAVQMILDDEETQYQVTKRLYPGVAEKHNTKPKNVERCIRHSIVCFIPICPEKTFEAIFGAYRYGGNYKRLTNATFLSLVANYLKMEDSNHD